MNILRKNYASPIAEILKLNSASVIMASGETQTENFEDESSQNDIF